MKILIFALFLPLIKSETPTSEKTPNFGCLNVDPVSNFDGEKFAGLWYEMEVFAPVSSTTVCIDLSLIWIKNLTSFRGIEIKNSDLYKVHYNQTFSWVPQNDTGIGNFRANYVEPQAIPDISVKILDTDYDNFAVLQHCYVLNGLSFRDITIYGRDRSISSTALQKAYDALVRFNSDQSNRLTINEKNCN